MLHLLHTVIRLKAVEFQDHVEKAKILRPPLKGEDRVRGDAKKR
jgi:hypothetical protein